MKKKNRYDAVEYLRNNSKQTGILKMLLQVKQSHKKSIVSILRRLNNIPAEASNKRVVDVYGYIRLAYNLDLGAQGDVIFDCVLEADILLAVPLSRTCLTSASGSQ